MSEAADQEYPIVIEGLRNSFGSFVVHDELSLKVRRGEIIGVTHSAQSRSAARPG